MWHPCYNWQKGRQGLLGNLQWTLFLPECSPHLFQFADGSPFLQKLQSGKTEQLLSPGRNKAAVMKVLRGH